MTNGREQARPDPAPTSNGEDDWFPLLTTTLTGNDYGPHSHAPSPHTSRGDAARGVSEPAQYHADGSGRAARHLVRPAQPDHQRQARRHARHGAPPGAAVRHGGAVLAQPAAGVGSLPRDPQPP